MPCAEILPPATRFAQMQGPLLVRQTAHGAAAITTHPRGAHVAIPLERGVHVAWAATPELAPEGVTLALFGGDRGDVGFATALSRRGLQALIRALKSIEAQLDEAAPC